MSFASGPSADRLVADAKDAYIRFWTNLHEATFRVTGGRVFNQVLGMPAVRLTTIGRRSGLPRTTMLSAPIVDTDRVVLVASNGGDDRDPHWFLNLLEQPDVDVTTGDATRSMRARVVTDATERERLWARIRTSTPAYSLYQRMTPRQLPVVVLEPR